jgi:hypothetical protein
MRYRETARPGYLAPCSCGPLDGPVEALTPYRSCFYGSHHPAPALVGLVRVGCGVVRVLDVEPRPFAARAP